MAFSPSHRESLSENKARHSKAKKGREGGTEEGREERERE